MMGLETAEAECMCDIPVDSQRQLEETWQVVSENYSSVNRTAGIFIFRD